jgi:hypothetical protein
LPRRARIARATGVGALPVVALGGKRAHAAHGVLSVVDRGVMALPAIVGLAEAAAAQGSATIVVVAAVARAATLLVSRYVLSDRAHDHGGSAER